MKYDSFRLNLTCHFASLAMVLLTCVLPANANDGGGMDDASPRMAMKQMRGDVNGDGERSIGDVMLMVNYLINGSDNFPTQIADMNDDKSVSIGDVMILIGVIMGNPYQEPDDPDHPTLPIDDDVPGGDPSTGL